MANAQLLLYNSMNIKIQFAVLGPVFSMSLTDVGFSSLIDASDLYKALKRAEITSSW